MRSWRLWESKLPLRLRLTGWYVLLLSLTLLLFSGYLHFQLERSEMAHLEATLEVDAALDVAASKLITLVGEQNSHPVFQKTKELLVVVRRFSHSGFAARLISADGTVWDGSGSYQVVPVWIPRTAGYANIPGDETVWHIKSQPLPTSRAQTDGWLQVMQPFEPVHEAAENLLTQIILSFPLVVLLTGLGGLFMSELALRPIDRITRIAQGISASDLTQRIGYRGPADEVGRLATTFDRMLDHLQAAFNRERQFVADASHELRTPLTVIKGRIGVTLSRPRSQAEYQKTLQELEREVDRLSRLTNALLFLTRIDQNLRRWQPERLEISNLLFAIVEQVRPLAESHQVSLSENIPSGLYVRGDSDHLIRLVLNLLDNAIKYTPRDGRVTITATHLGGEVLLVVSDTGPGIPPEHLPHLFERFYRVEAARSRNTGGSGLGLAIAQEIVRLHGGRLEVDSVVNRGSTFTVCLPYC